MKTVFKYLFIGLLGISLFSFSNSHQHRSKDWNFLGSRTVNFKLDKDVVEVGAKQGVYSKLLFKVNKGSLNMHKVVVSYGNGTREEINLKHQFQKGTITRSIDLKGKGRVVKQIAFWYDTQNRSGRKATLQVYGRH